MKKVVSTQQVAHLWAHQSQSEAYTQSRNFYFEENTIYSYGRHFPIASIVTSGSGEERVFMTTRGYSNTTAKHIRHVWSAVPNKSEIIKCYNPQNASWLLHAENILRYIVEIEGAIKKMSSARKPEKYTGELEYWVWHAKNYINFFGVDTSRHVNAEGTDLSKLIEHLESEEWASKVESLREKSREYERKAQEKKAKEHERKLAEWLKGETNYLSRLNYDYLRVNTNMVLGDFCETSQGIRIPLIAAKKYYDKVVEIIGLGGGEVEGLTFAGYNVRSISESGVVVGCHHFTIDEIKRFANSQGWTK